MKYILMAFAMVVTVTFSSCGEAKQQKDVHPFQGTFLTELGVRFELRPDSTALIMFSDSLQYESHWSIKKNSDNEEYVNIEFGGYQSFYYLKDQKLYRSVREMDHDILGVKINYQE